jgi:hypothetical protein
MQQTIALEFLMAFDALLADFLSMLENLYPLSWRNF